MFNWIIAMKDVFSTALNELVTVFMILFHDQISYDKTKSFSNKKIVTSIVFYKLRQVDFYCHYSFMFKSKNLQIVFSR